VGFLGICGDHYPVLTSRFAFLKRIAHITRMNSFLPSPDKLTQLDQRMKALGVLENDLEETFVRSGGAGGQKVNKSASCVMLLHRPTGLRVKCQTTRHQALNRFLARRLLLDKIERRQKGYVEAERAAIEKIRRQKRKRSRRAQERRLADKAHQGQKKQFRGNITAE
jgi:protein subunit release factor B